MKITFTLLIVSASFNLFSQAFINGDLEGTVDQFNPNLDLVGWEYVSYLEPFSEANWSGGETSDITGPNGPLTQYGILGTPHSGATFVSGLYSLADTTIWHEGIQQTVSGFSPDNEYVISYYQANVKQINSLNFQAVDPSGAWSTYVDGVLVNTSSSTISNLAFDASNLQWEYREFVFYATDTVHTFAFLPADDDNSIDGATSEALRMGIDEISIQSFVSVNELASIATDVYPNPTSDVLNIVFKNPTSASVTLYDLQGHVMHQEIVDAKKEMQFKIDAPSGIYILEILTEDSAINRFNVTKI